VADIVRRYDDDFKAFHRKVRDAGKPKKLIRIALARKLLIRLNAKARDVRLQLAPDLTIQTVAHPRIAAKFALAA
jgi:transposase